MKKLVILIVCLMLMGGFVLAYNSKDEESTQMAIPDTGENEMATRGNDESVTTVGDADQEAMDSYNPEDVDLDENDAVEEDAIY